ncbi:DUF4194 domain-containing protein [Enterococcus casseliflavus]|uniref:DUF4194 domain-containing protein n=1 Tax=Enterococcus TaxID=1350 RepID=UPI001A95C0FB|nr:DUF4194 domain-containing protein [Enterococcus casseliflavus]MBO1094971.1 DUF4194 domain-containing protein [Enterococcus casseliflavus]MBO1143379.1 DUF4194 domain-containing protein [Enterococcus casseliflavus]MBV6371322.1 DUF4194 domain-containing protein [Enterococcus casseliflavus]WEI91881.1 DUF4194 domain-containing protein [Enterococcus casseliflavus]
MYELNFVEAYDNLTSEAVLKFQKAVTRLLNCTYINRIKNDGQNWDEDYLFIEEKFELFEEYFKFGGYEVRINRDISVISIQGQFSSARKKLDKETTLYILALRLFFDEKIKEFNGSSTIVVRVAEFIDKLLEYGIKDKKPNLQALSRCLRYLSTVGILGKKSGKWEDADTLFIIYPSIKLLLPNERLDEKLKLIVGGQ